MTPADLADSILHALLAISFIYVKISAFFSCCLFRR